jgi:hypothetical protein
LCEPGKVGSTGLGQFATLDFQKEMLVWGSAFCFQLLMAEEITFTMEEFG